MSKKKKHRILTGIDLTGFHSSGNATGYVGDRKVYAENAIPGENADIIIKSKNQNHFIGKAVKVNVVSGSRINPVCRHFGLCGGCNWQHLAYEAQLVWKRRILQDVLKKYQIMHPDIQATIPSPQATSYRNRIEYSFSSRRWYYEGEGKVENPDERIAMGFHPAGNSGKVLQIEECHLPSDQSLLLAKGVEDLARNNKFTFYDPKEQTGLIRSLVIRTSTLGEIMMILVFASEDVSGRETILSQILKDCHEISSLYYTIVNDLRKNFSEGELILYGETSPAINEKCNDLIFRIGPVSFYQPNPQQAENVYRKIVELARLTGKEMIYDLYSGIGTIALHLASNARLVTGIEGSVQAVRDSSFNAAANKIQNARFICGDVLATFNDDFLEENGVPDIIVLDPPRSGTLIEIKKTILKASPDKIIYLSCNPVSLAIDLKMLLEDYRITFLQPYDMFPQTHHVETLVLLEKER